MVNDDIDEVFGRLYSYLAKLLLAGLEQRARDQHAVDIMGVMKAFQAY